MKALILAAGYGVRLYPLTKKWPKPLLRVKRKPIIDYIIRQIADIKEIDEIYVITNKKFYGLFNAWNKRFKSWQKISIISDATTTNENRLGAIGDIKFAINKKRVHDDLLIIGGDNLFKFNLRPFVDLATRDRAFALGIYNIKNKKDAGRFGVVTIDKKSLRLKTFEEKPAKPKSTYIAMCAYVFPKDKLGLIDKYIKEKNNLDAPGHYISWIVKNRHKIYGHVFSGRWFDIGQKETLKLAQKKF